MDILTRTKFYRKVKPEVWEIIKRLQQLRKLGKTDNEIFDVLVSLNLPLGLHLFITGHYSDLMEATFSR